MYGPHEPKGIHSFSQSHLAANLGSRATTHQRQLSRGFFTAGASSGRASPDTSLGTAGRRRPRSAWPGRGGRGRAGRRARRRPYRGPSQCTGRIGWAPCAYGAASGKPGGPRSGPARTRGRPGWALVGLHPEAPPGTRLRGREDRPTTRRCTSWSPLQRPRRTWCRRPWPAPGPIPSQPPRRSWWPPRRCRT